MSHLYIVFPHQLFDELCTIQNDTQYVLIEDDLFFRQYPFHKQKILLHRASMKAFQDRLETSGGSVEYIETSSQHTSMDALEQLLKRLDVHTVHYYDVVDDWLQQQLEERISKLHVTAERHMTPAFLTTPGQINEYFDTRPNRMQQFYEWQRKRLQILIDENDKPVGGKWSYDEANRKKLPKSIALPPAYPAHASAFVADARSWVERHFHDNPGTLDTFQYPITHHDAEERLDRFLSERLTLFGPYEDALSNQSDTLFHSVISPLLNNGLLTPQQVVSATLQFARTHSTPIESVEGFIRQIIGWREYMRATYIRYGRKMRTSNHLDAQRSLSKGWWTGETGIAPIDDTIQKVLNTAYAHHIERLMILGNAMVLLRINPDEVYEWFMSLFIDAYDWVMVPNVYAMSQFAAANFITTKPYVSGSNYIIKMSDYKKDGWAEIWDALYWRFISDFSGELGHNPRTSMMVSLYNRLSDEKKASIHTLSSKWI